MSYCLMNTHYHLMLEVDDETLPVGMHALNFRYAMTFNGRHRMKGHVFGAGYDANRIGDEAHLLTVFKYIACNPVMAHLCGRPIEWPWSSYAGSVGCGERSSFVDPSAVIECFGGVDELALARLRRFVEEP